MAQDNQILRTKYEPADWNRNMVRYQFGKKGLDTSIAHDFALPSLWYRVNSTYKYQRIA